MLKFNEKARNKVKKSFRKTRIMEKNDKTRESSKGTRCPKSAKPFHSKITCQ